MSIKAVFLDLGGVIVEVSWKPVLIEMGYTETEAQDEIISLVGNWENHHRYERGEISELEFFVGLGDLIQKPETKALITAWNKMLIRPLPGVEEIFKKFKGRIPLMALSNTNLTHVEYMQKNFSFLKMFDHVFTSYELGHRKPEQECYLKAAAIAQLEPSEILFIDDNPDNVDAAIRAGYKAELSMNSTSDTIRLIERYLTP